MMSYKFLPGLLNERYYEQALAEAESHNVYRVFTFQGDKYIGSRVPAAASLSAAQPHRTAGLQDASVGRGATRPGRRPATVPSQDESGVRRAQKSGQEDAAPATTTTKTKKNIRSRG